MPQQHKAQTHSGSHANLAVNRAHKRRKIYTGPNRFERREPLHVAHAEKQLLENIVQHPIENVVSITRS